MKTVKIYNYNNKNLNFQKNNKLPNGQKLSIIGTNSINNLIFYKNNFKIIFNPLIKQKTKKEVKSYIIHKKMQYF